jgi:hypothetical protein
MNRMSWTSLSPELLLPMQTLLQTAAWVAEVVRN